MTVIYGNRGSSKAVQDVAIQDQTSDTVILPLVQQLGSDTLAADGAIDDYTITLVDATGFLAGDHIRIINSAADRYYWGTIVSVASNVVTLDTQLDYAYLAGSEVTRSNENLAVDGSVTPVHFHLRTGSPSIPSSIDIVRMIMVCECSSSVDLNKFGDITGGLTNGIVFRMENGKRRNIWNVKKNRDLVALAYDFTVFSVSNPAQGINGFSWRLTFGSAGKIGVVLRILQDGQLGLIVQDDLTDLVNLKCIVEGHIVE